MISPPRSPAAALRISLGARPPDPAEWGIIGNEFPVDPDRWADERQYSRCDPTLALTAFRRRRGDDNHLDQLARALSGRA